jgi:hypothetical protein
VDCPDIVGGAKVICASHIDGRHRHTGNTSHVVAGDLVAPASGLAIGQYSDEDTFYLFGCNEVWDNVTDTCHGTLQEALEQAEFEYEGVSKTWVYKP